MRCPRCGGESEVLSTRRLAEGYELRRRRLCLGRCRQRFTTHEEADVAWRRSWKPSGSLAAVEQAVR